MKKTILFFAILLVLVSCQGENTTNYFKGRKVAETTFAKQYDITPQKVNLPWDNIEIIKVEFIDTLIFVKSYNDSEYHYKILDAKNMNIVANIFRNGRGHNEFLGVWYAGYHKKDNNGNIIAYFESDNIKYVFSVNISEYIRTGEYEIEKIVTPPHIAFFPTVYNENQTIFIHYNELNKNQEFIFVDNKSDSIVKRVKINKFKYIYPGIKVSTGGDYNKKFDKIAFPSSKMNQIMSLDLKTEKTAIFSNEKELLSWDYVKSDDSKLISNYPSTCVSDDYIFALKRNSDIDYQIQILDWNCKPVAAVNFQKEEVFSLTYNKNDNCAYISTRDGEIYKFDLSKII